MLSAPVYLDMKAIHYHLKDVNLNVQNNQTAQPNWHVLDIIVLILVQEHAASTLNVEL